ncbi:uncharacterized protein [Temnothorax longispinosus]|uniref:uncharacterized protein n=1 Tax=Temnothorax longispinosus TaxID=300112 RepID=UPI003A99AC53
MANTTDTTSAANALTKMTVDELAEKLRDLGLPTTDNRAALRERLRKALEPKDNLSQTDETSGIFGGENALMADSDDLTTLSKEALKSRLRELGLQVSGTKPVLRERLRAALQRGEDDEDDTSDEEDDIDEEADDTFIQRDDQGGNMVGARGGVASVLRGNMGSIARGGAVNVTRGATGGGARSTPIRELEMARANEDIVVDDGRITRGETRNSSRTVLTFKDVEDALETFSGDGTQSVRRWFALFEETAELCSWTNAQRVIYVKRLLRGSAKLFANFECHAQSYRDLKKALVEEFDKTLNSRQIHKELSAVTKKTDETFQEYIYRVLELASHAEMEIEAKIQYIIDGVKDEESNKAILYNATTIKELRQRFVQYETQQTNRNKAKHRPQTASKDKMASSGNRVTATSNPKKCYNCGDTKHLGKECPHKAKGSKCYSCGEFGHIAAKCSKGSDAQNKDATPKRVDIVRSHGDKKIYKDVKILNKDVTAVIDSGSDLHLMRSSFYVLIGAPQIRPVTMKFDGMGITDCSTLGRFTADVTIDGLTLTLDIDVVPDYFTTHDFLLGGELSDFAEIHIRKQKATLTEFDNEESKTSTDMTKEETAWSEVLCVNIQDEEDERAKDEINLNHIEDVQVKERVREMVQNYCPEKTKDSGVKMHLILKDEVPVHQNPRRLSAEQRSMVNEIVDKWISKGIARPSRSEYASPIVLVKKKNGEPRLCVDYRRLNRKIVRDRYPLPLVEDQLDRLARAKVFCTLDLKDGFFHVPIDEPSIHYTSFVTPDGQFEFLMVPFGLSNSPAVFQRHIKAVFQELITKGTVLTYLDGLIIPAEGEQDGLQKLEEVLNMARNYGLRINWSKCSLMTTRVEYLGHIVEAGTVKPSEKKVSAVARFPEPTSTKAVQSFLGLTGYFRKFIPQYALMARPLLQLLKMETFIFADNQRKAFNQLKTALTTNPVLKLYKVGATTELHTDASRLGLGAILLQRDGEDNQLHPVYYASWKTIGAKERYSSFELEVLAIIKALRKFRAYLLGIPFRIITDCKAFVQTMSRKIHVQEWRIGL